MGLALPNTLTQTSWPRMMKVMDVIRPMMLPAMMPREVRPRQYRAHSNTGALTLPEMTSDRLAITEI